MNKHSIKKHTLSLCLTAILATSVFAVPASAASVGGATLTTGVRLRAGAGTGYESITIGNQGDSAIVLGNSNNGWNPVIYKGIQGYMSTQYLKYSQTLTDDFGIGTITGTNVRMRAGAGTNTAILGTYNSGATMNVTGVSGNWYQVSCNGVTGYVHSDYMKVSPGGDVYAQTLGVTNTASALTTTAKNLLGVRYVYGGTTTNGFDCSGFTQYVFAQNGIALDRTAAQQYTNNGTSVSKSDLQVGDLVFFSSSSQSVGHVGMYIGDGQFIHASSGGGKVIITDLNSSYYVRNYVGAKRVL